MSELPALAFIALGVVAAVAMLLASRFAVRHAVIVAEGLHLPPFIVGITLVALGTDMPEIVNSVISSRLGHGDINVGDSIGSVFTQGALILGLFPFIANKALPLHKRDALLTTALTAAALLAGLWLFSDGFVSHTDGAVLVGIWVAATLMAWRLQRRGHNDDEQGAPTHDKHRPVLFHAMAALLALAAVGAAASVLVNAVSSVAAWAGIPEYVLSFFGASVGTSLPELAVEITAVRRGQRQLAVGDLVGSCLIDASLSVGIGPMLFPTAVDEELAVRGAVIALAAMMLVALIAVRGRHDKMTGAVLIAAYLLAYVLFLR